MNIPQLYRKWNECLHKFLFNFLKSTNITVILSHPKPLCVSGAVKVSKSLSIMLLNVFDFNPFLQWLKIYAFDFNSQTPSHPRSMKSSSLVNYFYMKSGTAIIFYSSWLRLESFLHSKSPMYRELCRFPSTKPSSDT